MEMSLQLRDIRKFERQNDISVSVYGGEVGKRNEDGEEDIWYAIQLYVAI